MNLPGIFGTSPVVFCCSAFPNIAEQRVHYNPASHGINGPYTADIPRYAYTITNHRDEEMD